MYLPLWFQTDQVRCVVIGGGRVALAKIQRLHRLGCDLTVIAPEILAELMDMVGERCRVKERVYQNGDCQGFNLIVAATPDRNINRKVSEEAKSLNIPVNVVDDPELCTVIFSANLHDDLLGIAVSTSGAAPYLAATLRDKLVEMTTGWGEWVSAGGRLRNLLIDSEMSNAEIARILKRFSRMDANLTVNYPQDDARLEDWLLWMDQHED